MKLFKITINPEDLRKKADFILQRLLLVFFFAILMVYASREVIDLDLWLHLKTGEVIVKTRAIPLYDIFSFTLNGKPWINHEWLFQALAYAFYSFGHSDGLIFMQNIVVIAIFLLLLFLNLKENNHVFMFVVLYMTLLALAYRFTIRPDIFSLLFITLTLFILTKFIENKSKALWLLPVFQLLWVNMHGFSFIGPLIILIFLIGEILKRAAPLPVGYKEAQRLNDHQMTHLIIVFALLLLASLVNPYGFPGVIYPFSVLGQLSGKGKVIFNYIQELAKPITLTNIFAPNNFFYYKALILVSLFSFRFNQKNINLSHFLLWLSFLCFSFLAIRNVAYFVIIAAYVTLSNVDLALKNKKQLPFRNISGRSRVFFSYLFMAFLFYYPGKGAMKYLERTTYNFDTYQLKPALWGFAENRYPKKAVEFLLKYPFPKYMINDFNAGAYLIGQAYPRRLVFIDGRTELYGPDLFLKYVALCEGEKETLENIFPRYNIQGAFLTNSVNDLHLGLMRYLFKNPHWKVVYFDEYAIIFLKDDAQNADLISRFKIDLKKWPTPSIDFLRLGVAFRYPSPALERARLLDALGCHEAAAKEARLALEIMPNNAEALKFISNYYFEKKDYLEAFKYARNSLIYSEGDLWMRSRLALIYHYLREDEKAAKVIDSIIKTNPKFAQGYYVKAYILKDVNRAQAEDFASRAIKILPKEPKYHILLGDLFRADRKPAEAKKEWEKALQYDSANEALRKKIEDTVTTASATQ
jgi:hypothetical protein